MKPSKSDMVEAEFPQFMKKYHPELYKTRDGFVLKLRCLCDGTYSFLGEMLLFLRKNGFRKIEFSESDVPEQAPEDKPWMSCLFEVWGLVPEK